MKALLRIDLQNDFCPGGALPVPGGDEVIEASNQLALSGKYDLVVDSQDWHPAEHGSFASQHPGRQPFDEAELNGLPQRLWPDHCVQHSPGADFRPQLDRSATDYVIRKGSDPNVDSYSAFFDNGQHSTGLDAWLRQRGVTEVDVVGLALDYCVAFTAIDAARLGYRCRVLLNACRSIGPVAPVLERLAESQVEVVGCSMR